MRMRIISGEMKGRLINVPESRFIRPTTDRVRETLFNLINNRISFHEISVLDLYAGSGALGLECISRGAASVHFVENNPVIYKNLQENIAQLKVSEKCTIYKMEAARFTLQTQKPGYDLILADPPFFKDDIYKTVRNIMQNKLLADHESPLFIERSVQTRENDTAEFGKEPLKIVGDACLYELYLPGK